MFVPESVNLTDDNGRYSLQSNQITVCFPPLCACGPNPHFGISVGLDSAPRSRNYKAPIDSMRLPCEQCRDIYYVIQY